MSERERWVVYPLLFLALGAALRDKLFDRTITRSVVCQELIVVDEETVGEQPLVLARIGRGNAARGSGPTAHMVVHGQLHADLVNAKSFAYRNVQFAPTVQTIWSGPVDFLRQLQRSIQPPRARVREPTAEKRESQLAPQPAGEGQDVPAAEPALADPAANR